MDHAVVLVKRLQVDYLVDAKAGLFQLFRFLPGYPSDERTMLFIKSWVERKKAPPVFARRSWKPLRLMLETLEQKTLV